MKKQHVMEGRSLSVFQSAFISISFDPANSLLLLDWKRQITLAERKQGFGKALELTRTHGVRNWLVNDLQLTFITPSEKAWVLSEFQEEASRTTIQRLAVVTTDYYPSLVGNTEFTAQSQDGYQTKGVIRHEVFPDHDSATRWLLSEKEWEV